jgi:predicted Mrr-cat superfamily restriction endonuclease
VSDYQVSKKKNDTYTAVVVTWKNEVVDRESIKNDLQKKLSFMLNVKESDVRILSAN